MFLVNLYQSYPGSLNFPRSSILAIPQQRERGKSMFIGLSASTSRRTNNIIVVSNNIQLFPTTLNPCRTIQMPHLPRATTLAVGPILFLSQSDTCPILMLYRKGRKPFYIYVQIHNFKFNRCECDGEIYFCKVCNMYCLQGRSQVMIS